MINLGRKKHKKRRWHADFRVVDRLPDTKVIRTKFIINAASIGIAAVLVALVGMRELNKKGIGNSIESLKSELSSRSGKNIQYTRSNMSFRQLANKVDDINAFKKTPIRPSQLLIELAKIRTPEIVYEIITYDHTWDNAVKEEVYQLELVGKGTSNPNIGRFEEQLKTLGIPEGYELMVKVEGNPTEDATSDLFNFQMSIRIKEAKNGSK